MDAYTTAVTTAFAMQRQAIEAQRQALDRSVKFGTSVTRAVAAGMESTASAQRRSLELQRSIVHSGLDTLEANVPGSGTAVADLREAVEEAYEALFDAHGDAVEGFEAELTESADAAEEFAADYLAAVDDYLELLLEAQAELEAQSVEIADQFAESVAELQAQMETVSARVGDVAGGTEAVEA